MASPSAAEWSASAAKTAANGINILMNFPVAAPVSSGSVVGVRRKEKKPRIRNKEEEEKEEEEEEEEEEED